MLLLLAMALMLAPMVALFVCERAAKKGRGPLAAPDRMPVLDGQIVSAPVRQPPSTEPVSTDPRDVERCAAESRLVRGLLDGTLDRARYRSEMAALAGATDSPPLQLPGEPG
jgi:hypothetical protein